MKIIYKNNQDINKINIYEDESIISEHVGNYDLYFFGFYSWHNY